MPGIAVVVVTGVLLSGWRRLGDQGAQVTFTALFVLLLGGHQPLYYVAHRMTEVAIGVATGLAVTIAVFPPLQLRPAEHAVRRWAEDIATALEISAMPPPIRAAPASSGPGRTGSSPRRHSRRGQRCGTRATACDGTPGREEARACRGPTAPCLAPLTS